jgi:hypothetical protein
MEINDQSSPELSIPQDVVRTKILVDNAETTDLLHRPRNFMLDGLVQSIMAHTLTTPAHEKHMTDPSRAVEEVGLGQTDRPEKDGNSRSLGTLEDPVDVYFTRDLPPESRRRPLPDNSISEGGTRNLEWCAKRPTRADGSAIMVQILIELRLELLHQVSCADRMAVLPSAKHMQLCVGALRVKHAALQ